MVGGEGVELMGIYGMETPCCGPFEATQEWVHHSKKKPEKPVYHFRPDESLNGHQHSGILSSFHFYTPRSIKAWR